MIRFDYKKYDVGFALLCIDELTLFYVMLSFVLIDYVSESQQVVPVDGQLGSHFAYYRNA
jgi:hypothetical protein